MSEGRRRERWERRAAVVEGKGAVVLRSYLLRLSFLRDRDLREFCWFYQIKVNL